MPLTLALQKSGRLAQQSLQLLADAGFLFDASGRNLRTAVTNAPLELLLLRAGDIPALVAAGDVDAGIVGQNSIAESGAAVEEIAPLGFGECRLHLAYPEGCGMSAADLNGKKVATSFPNLLTNFLQQQGVQANIERLSGSVEVAPHMGLADAVCDLVSTGGTLASHGLRVGELVFSSQAVLAATPNLGGEKSQQLQELAERIQSVMAGRQNRYVVMNAPESKLQEIIACAPGLGAPTVSPLAGGQMLSVSVVVPEATLFQTLPRLRAAGATGILVLPISQLLP